MSKAPLPSGVEFHRMISGHPYLPSDPELASARRRARSLTFRFNQTPAEEGHARRDLLLELLGSAAGKAYIEPVFHCDYGFNIHVGARFYANANCVMLDVAEIRTGDDVMLGPAVQLLTATHPVDPVERVAGRELGHPIIMGDRVWLGGGVIVCPGVTIGDDVVVGAGAVVTRDLPNGVVAAGNPARVIRTIGLGGHASAT
jgi:maltose O-acetyltransferase